MPELVGNVSEPIKEYIRPNFRSNGPFKGTLVGIKIAGSVYIGWSLCSRKDYFSREFGTALALARIHTCSAATRLPMYRINKDTMFKSLPHPIFPPSLHLPVNLFAARCGRYFKCEDKDIYVVINKHTVGTWE